MNGVGVMARRALPEGGLSPLRTSPHQGAAAPWTAGFEAGESGRGIIGDTDATGVPCPSPIPPIKSRVPRALSPWRGGSGEGKALPAERAAP